MSFLICECRVGVNGAVAILADDQQIVDDVLSTLRFSTDVVGVLAFCATPRPARLTEAFSTLYGERAGLFHGYGRWTGFTL